jgi:hypothetical protein
MKTALVFSFAGLVALSILYIIQFYAWQIVIGYATYEIAQHVRYVSKNRFKMKLYDRSRNLK